MSGTAPDLLRTGDPAGALKALQDEVRARPEDAKLRVFLFQLLCVLGQWDRALNQLNVAAQLDASALAMAQMYREAIRCELLRAKVFGGATAPMVFGQPEEWLALLIEALLLAGRGKAKEAAELRGRAFEAAVGAAGTVDGKAFEWIADADSRLGPVLEAIVNGRYYWVPFARLAKVAIEAPADLRDVVWIPAHLEFVNGGETVALVPTRYPGSEGSEDPQILLSRKTVWSETGPDTYHGLGQRVFVTDAGETALMDVRALAFALGASA
jgi:type VI secretion system protein ImpE